MRDWMDVANLVKTRNLNGGLVVQCTPGLPFLLEEGEEVAFVPPQTDLPRRATVAAVRPIDDASSEVIFDGVDGDAARGLVGCHCLIRRRVLDDSVFEDEPGLWNGWEVVDGRFGMLGVVAGIVDNPAQALLEVDRADGRGILLVPAVDEIVNAVDVATRTVHVSIPDGLLEL